MKKNLLPVVLIAGLIVVGIFLYIQDSTKTDKVADKNIKIGIIPVSYTHLTLPTMS